MSRIKTVFLFCALVMSAIICQAQTGVSIGNWRTHLPYQKVIDVEIFGSKVYAATTYELFYYDQDDNSLQILNKINGLSDIGISTIRYNKNQDVLFVAYTNTNIDLIDSDGNITNMNDIKEKNIIGNKTINNVFFIDQYAYVACGFGIVVIDLKREEVKDTYYIGAEGASVNVTDIALFDGKLYASTDYGIYYASINNPNLSNFYAWTFDRTLIHPFLSYNEMEVFNDKLLLNYLGGFNQDTLFVFDGTTWDYFDKSSTSRKYELRAYEDALAITNNYNVLIYDKNFTETHNIYSPNGSIIPLSCAIDSKGTFWIGDSQRGMVKSTNGWGGEDIRPNGPYTNSVYQLNACGDQVWIATGGHDANWGKRYMKEGVAHFDGNWWTSINRTTEPVFDTVSDFVCTATDPLNPSVTYVGLWGKGLLKLEDDKFVEVYSTHNSTLGVWTADQSLVNISGLAFDSKNNLWVANTGTNNLLSVMEPDGTWHSYNLGGLNSSVDISTMVIDQNDYKWILKRNGGEGKIIVFNDNGTLDNTSDDQVALLYSNSGQGGISGTTVSSIAVDRDGAVWVGTDSGPCVFYDPKKIFNSTSFDASQIMIPRNDGTGQADPLLKDIKVLSIVIDGGNNKWFGLESGIIQMSSDCLTELNNFTTENSPLLDNAINTMAIDKNGEVFFGTDKGVISYRGKASDGGETNSNVYAYPNPVRKGYSGQVGIKGLVTDALVRITTVDGAFVTQLRADGGQASWDCTNINGQKVTPGIYLIFVSTDAGQERIATKVLIMN